MKNQQAKTTALSNPVQREEMILMMTMTFLPVIMMTIRLVAVMMSSPSH